MTSSSRTCATLAIGLAALTSFASLAQARDLKEAEARGAIRALVASDEQPEMFALTAEAAPGFEREILDGFAKAHGLKVEVTTVPTFEQMIPTLLRGDGDLIIGIIDTESRRRQINFTIETLPARHLVVNRKPAAPLNDMDAVRHARVGVIQGTSWAEAAAAAGVSAANTVQLPDLPAVLAALQAGRVAATVMSAPDYALAQKRDSALQAGTFIGPNNNAAWGVRKADRALVDALNDQIFTLRNSRAWEQLVAKYFSPEAFDLFRRARKPAQ